MINLESLMSHRHFLDFQTQRVFRFEMIIILMVKEEFLKIMILINNPYCRYRYIGISVLHIGIVAESLKSLYRQLGASRLAVRVIAGP